MRMNVILRKKFNFNVKLALVAYLMTASFTSATPSRNYEAGTLRHYIWHVEEFKDLGIHPTAPISVQNPPLKVAIVTNFGTQDGINTLKSDGTGLDFDASWNQYTLAQKRVRALFLVSRLKAVPFFEELRVAEPVFFLPGDDKEKNIYILARYHAMRQSFGYQSSDSAPEHLTVTYNRKVKTPDGGEIPLMENVAKGQYMLSGERQPANHEKPGVHKIIEAGLGKEAAQKRVRELVAKLTKDAIRDHATDTSFDVAQYVARTVPLQVVSEYFGFYPPDRLTQIQWSRNTQNSFFHNPTNYFPIDALALRSGNEMASYIAESLLPELKIQLNNGRPAYDALSQLINGHMAALGAKNSPELDKKSITHAMGFLIGAGETSIFAVVRGLQMLLDQEPAILAHALALAQEGRDEAFAHYVWEALRFYPINPWVERYATKSYRIYAIPEKSGSITNLVEIINANRRLNEPGAKPELDYDVYTIEQGSRVMVAMQSAFMDSEKFPEPKKFNPNRPLADYFHVSVDYHRCLGDDVVDAMIPEIYKQLLLNLHGLNRLDATGSKTVAANRLPDYLTLPPSPFPESWSLSFTSKSAEVSKPSSRLATAVKMLNEKIPTLTNVETKPMVNYLIATQDQRRVVDSSIRFDFKSFQEVKTLMDLTHKAIVETADLRTPKYCTENPEMAVENLDGPSLSAFCEFPIAFRSCFFLQRTAGQKSTQHAFNTCAYHWKSLDEANIAIFKQLFGGLEPFAFLKYQVDHKR